jgi:hypothetical protein
MAIKVVKNRYQVDKETKTSVKLEITDIENKLLFVSKTINTSIANKNFNITDLINQSNLLSVKLTQAKKKLELLSKFGKSLGVYIQETSNNKIENLEE